MRSIKTFAVLSALALCMTPTVTAQEAASETAKKAMVAGYKALFTCSATFSAGQSRAEIEANELSGIYEDYRPHLRNVSDANISDRARTVAVQFDRNLPPRLAKWRAGMGCSLLPVGASPNAADWLPGFVSVNAPTARDVSTALGDNVTLTDNLASIDRLGAPISFAFDGETYGEGNRTSAILILHKGQVIGEQYARGIDAETPQRTWSVAKSLNATIIGAAIQDGRLGLDNEAVLTDWNQGADPRRAITLRHLLHMASGLESGTRGSRTDRVYFGGVSALDMIKGRMLEAEPGSRFKYSNYDTLIAMRHLRERLDDDARYFTYPYEMVLNKIGAARTILETDWAGDFISSSQVWMTARDMARLGQLYLQNGAWGGEQILPSNWVDFVTTPAPDQPDSGSFGYGGSFWLLRNEEGVPRDTYAALGNRGQHLIIVPSRELVIVRRGFDVAGQEGFNIAAFTRDVVSVLDLIEAERIAALLPDLEDEEAE